MKLIELNLQRIFDLCRTHRVKSLAVFGSILTDRFNDNSDVDLLVNFDTTDHEKWDYVTNFLIFRMRWNSCSTARWIWLWKKD